MSVMLFLDFGQADIRNPLRYLLDSVKSSGFSPSNIFNLNSGETLLVFICNNLKEKNNYEL